MEGYWFNLDQNFPFKYFKEGALIRNKKSSLVHLPQRFPRAGMIMYHGGLVKFTYGALGKCE